MFETDTVVEIDLASNGIVAEYGAFPGGYAFPDPATAFDHQHMPAFTALGTLMTQTDSPIESGAVGAGVRDRR